MDQWLYENLFIIILASISSFNILNRVSQKLHRALIEFPVRCYLNLAASQALGQRKPQACHSKNSMDEIPATSIHIAEL